MNYIFKLAWRNIWRNKRRAFITMSSISISLVLVIFMMQLQKKQWMQTIDSSISGYVGYIQISDTAFVDESVLDNSIDLEQVDMEALRKIEGVRGVYPRIQSAALASIGIKSKFAGILGITPSLDNDEMKLPQKLLEGELITDTDKNVMITKTMAQYYKVGVGDTLVAYGMGYQGFTAAGLYRIKGIINIPAGDLSNMIYMSMPEAQYFFAAPNRVTSVLVNIEENGNLYEIQREVRANISDQSLIARNWEEVLPAMKEGMEIDSISNQAMLAILLVIVCFGIFGTIVMLYNERIFEFGIMLSIGMKKQAILFSTLAEIYLLSLLGILASWIIVTPILYFIKTNPIQLSGNMKETMISYGMDPVMSVGMYPELYFNSSAIILIFTVIMSLYVVNKVANLNPLDAMRKN